MILNSCVFRSTLISILVIISLLEVVSTYECYVCTQQPDNNGKCIKTVRTCEVGENSCLTIVRWGSTPYWDPTGSKQHYIEKRCATSSVCELERQNKSHRCDRIWYNDWECVECCTGDRCNYFITLGSSSIQPMNILTIIIVSIISFWSLNFNHNR